MEIINYILKFIELFKPTLTGGVSNTLISELSEQDYIATSGEEFADSKVIDISMIPVKNQQNIGSCCSHAVCMLYEHEFYKQNKIYLEMSELYHYYIVRKEINNTYPLDKGQTIYDGIKCVYKYGICPEKLSPYKIENYNEEVSMMQDSFANLLLKKYPVTAYYRLIDVDDIKRTLDNDNLVLCGLRVDYNFLKREYEWIPGGSIKGGHAVVIYGYNADYFYFRNSWGESYGSNGNFKVKITDVMSKGFDFMQFII